MLGGIHLDPRDDRAHLGEPSALREQAVRAAIVPILARAYGGGYVLADYLTKRILEHSGSVAEREDMVRRACQIWRISATDEPVSPRFSAEVVAREIEGAIDALCDDGVRVPDWPIDRVRRKGAQLLAAATLRLADAMEWLAAVLRRVAEGERDLP